jgi:hypothetical protein
MHGSLQQRSTVLDVDRWRANLFPDDYETDLELPWSNLSEIEDSSFSRFYSILSDLFAEGDDFSLETIEKNRNRFFQQQHANQISSETRETIDLLTNSLNIHLNLEQNLTFETPNAFMTLGTVPMQSLSNRILSPLVNSPIRLPKHFSSSSLNNQSSVSFRVCLDSSIDFEYLHSDLVIDSTVGIIGSFFSSHQSLTIRVIFSFQRGRGSLGANERD